MADPTRGGDEAAAPFAEVDATSGEAIGEAASLWIDRVGGAKGDRSVTGSRPSNVPGSLMVKKTRATTATAVMSNRQGHPPRPARPLP